MILVESVSWRARTDIKEEKLKAAGIEVFVQLGDKEILCGETPQNLKPKLGDKITVKCKTPTLGTSIRIEQNDAPYLEMKGPLEIVF